MAERLNKMEDNKKSGYSAEGRKLRPRRNAASGSDERGRAERYNYQDKPRSTEHRAYGEHRSYGDRPQGEHRSYGSRPQGERRPYGDRPQGERRSYGEHRAYGEGRSYGEGRERRPYGENREGGERRPYGERRSYGERRAYSRPDGERRPYGDRPQGERRSYGNRPQGERRPVRKKYDSHFNENDEAGIDRMIARRPAIDSSRYSDNDMAPTPFKEEVRLNKFIANSGVCSRREADTFIQAGVVTVNGEVVTELGTKINVLKDEVRFNGERLKGEEKVYIVMNKPKDYVTTSSDPHAEKTVMDILKGCPARVFPVGRLDKNTTGVLMFTNDGEIAERLTHPSYDKKKIYQVMLDSELTQEDYDKILSGITLSDGEVAADALEFIDEKDHRKVGIEIHSGKNRIVRRIFESLGYYVRALDRVYFAGLTKKGLQKGEWRYLTEGEVNILKMGAYV